MQRPNRHNGLIGKVDVKGNYSLLFAHFFVLNQNGFNYHLTIETKFIFYAFVPIINEILEH